MILPQNLKIGQYRIEEVNAPYGYTEYPTSVQTVLALCVGLKLPLPEAEMFLGKTDFKLNSLKGEGYIYQCVMGACAENSIYEINEMLKENGITPLGSDPDLQ